jgi:outer membrane protein OmpA-like peptidoglycan-associated protein
MFLTDEEGRARPRRVQPTVTPQQPGGNRRDPVAVAALGLLLLLGGCSDVPDRINPVNWWHQMEGGEIAQDRPPPPNPNAPFPKIGNQPARPAGMPDAEWAQLSAALAANRASAQSYAAQNPIPTLPQTAPAPAPTSPAAARPRPAPVAVAPVAVAAAPADAVQSSATAAEIARLAAAPGPAGSEAPPPDAAGVATATANANANTNAGTNGAAGLTFQGPSARPRASAPPSVPIADAAPSPGSPNPGGPVAGTKIDYFDPSNGLSIPGALSPVAQPDEAHPPPVPASIPAPPAVPGFAISTVPATYVAPVPLPQPAPYVPPATLPAVGPVPIQFAAGSAVLTPPMQKALLSLIQGSQGAHFAVTGFGDAAGASISDQAAAMPLALERTRAMVVQLMAYGVKPLGISADAQARGTGGLARLVD